MSLRYRIAVTVFLLGAATVLASVWLAAPLFGREVGRHLERADKDLAQLMLAPAKAALVAEEYADFQHYIEGLKDNPSIAAVTLTDAGGRVVAATPVDAIGGSAPAAAGAPEHSHVADVVGASGRLGTLVVRVSGAPLAQATRWARGVGLLAAAVGMALVAGAGLLLGGMRTRRLAQLTDMAERIARGDRGVRAPAGGSDEVARLARALNRMAAEVERNLEALRASEERSRVLVESGPTAIWVLDADSGRLTDVNPQTEQLTRYARTQLIGRTLEELSPPQQPDGRPTRDCAEELIRRVRAGETVRLGWTIRDAHGADLPCELHATRLALPGRNLLCGSVADISERVHALQALHYLSEFEGLVARLSTRFIGLDSAGLDEGIHAALAEIGAFAGVDRSYVFLLDEGGQTFGCRYEWCRPGIQSYALEMQSLPVDDYPWSMGLMRAGEVLHLPRLGGAPPEADPERMTFKAHGVQSIVTVPLIDNAGAHGFVGFDSVRHEIEWSHEVITLLRIVGEIVLNALERRRADHALHEHSEALERSIGELERSNADLQQFAYIASHDLREPLRSVGSFAGLLARRYKGQLGADADEYIGFILDAVARMNHLIADVMDYTRVHAQLRPFERCNLAGILHRTLQNLDAAVRESGARITWGELPELLGDPSQLMLLLQNLIGNALKFHGEAAPEVHVEAGRVADGWRVCVRDNGIGIAPADARRLFQIFKRLHPQERYPGTGMGLAICKRIVERHNGRIGVEPNPAGGSVFWFVLPATDAAARAA